MRAVTDDRRASRRGVTLMEMLVTVALLVLVMSILVSIFRSATEAITIHQVSAVLDQDLRRIDTMIRQDLDGVTATMTPPLNPKNGKGYFTYGENEIADAQNEDTDDWLAFTAKAPSYQPFTGYMMVPVTGQNTGTVGTPRQYQRVAIKSQYAEVFYFLRGQTLYRRVFLILPPNHPLYIGSDQSLPNGQGAVMGTGGFTPVDPTKPMGVYTASGTPAVGWQYLNDISAHPAPATAVTPLPVLNSLSDLTQPHNRTFRRRFSDDYYTIAGTPLAATSGADGNGDDFNGGAPDGIPDYYPTMYAGIFSASGRTLINWHDLSVNLNATAAAPLARNSNTSYDVLGFPYEFPGGFPNANPPTVNLGPIHTARADSTGTALINHAPLEIGDPLGYPTAAGGYQTTFWAFPTKNETMSPSWTDPVYQLNMNGGTQAPGLSLGTNAALLPPMTSTYRMNPQPFTDGSGATTFVTTNFKYLVDEDAVATNVRSFDVKVLDVNTLIYHDLGYGDINGSNLPANLYVANYLLQGFSHEGRMPPLTGDLRSDMQFPAYNVGDDNVGVRRLRRIYDTWSTDYSYPPWQTLDPNNWPGYPSVADPTVNNPPPIPGYPPPYPATLRGMQIQIRFVDPRNERLKVLTIRHDFTDNQ